MSTLVVWISAIRRRSYTRAKILDLNLTPLSTWEKMIVTFPILEIMSILLGNLMAITLHLWIESPAHEVTHLVHAPFIVVMMVVALINARVLDGSRFMDIICTFIIWAPLIGFPCLLVILIIPVPIFYLCVELIKIYQLRI